MLSSSTPGRGRKTACEMCRARKRKCDGRLPSCSLCQKAQFRCIYAIRSPNTPDSGVMFHSIPGTIGTIHTNANPPQVDTSANTNYDFNQYLAGGIDPRQHTISLPLPTTLDSSGSSEIAYNMPDRSPLQQNSLGWLHRFPAQFEMTPPELALDASAFEDMSQATFATTDGWQNNLPTPPSTAAPSNESSQLQLPSQDRVLEMVNSFFAGSHQLLPSAHKESFIARLTDDMAGLCSGPFLWVILALYCSCDKSELMQAQYRSWMQTAHSKLESMSTARVQSNTTNMLQASIWMIFDAYCRGDVTNAWLLLGRTAQLTSALGLDRIDSKHRTPRMENEMKSRSDIEVEERRKCMWCLALLDRVIVSVNGLALSVDDRYFHIDFPLPDDEFQQARQSIADVEYLRESYSSEAFDLLNGNATSTMATKPSFEHVLKVSVILGRALAIQNSVRHDDSNNRKQNFEKLRMLESVLNTFCYAASASGEALGPTSLMQLWLKMLTQCSKILMLHPPSPSILGLCNCLSSASPRAPPTGTDTECVRAAINAASTFGHAVQETPYALNNPFLLPMACTAVRMLTLLKDQMHEHDRDRVQGLIAEILRVVDHVAIKFPGAAGKARETIMRRIHDMENGTRRNSLGVGALLMDNFNRQLSANWNCGFDACLFTFTISYLLMAPGKDTRATSISMRDNLRRALLGLYLCRAVYSIVERQHLEATVPPKART